MGKQIWLGKFLIASRILFFIALYFLAISSPVQKELSFQSFWDFILTFGKRWDGNSYTFIADHWYVTTGPEKYFIVFPPLYPILIRILTIVTQNSTVSGMIISNIFFVWAMVIFYKLLRLDYSQKSATLAIVLISIFPTSFFLSVAYPESLFIFLFVSAFYLCRKRQYFPAGTLAGLAAVTRPFGILLLPALIFQIFLQKDLNIKRLITLAVTSAIPILFYLWINYSTFGDPFAFLTLLKENWHKSFSFPWEGILASWKRGGFFVGYSEAIASTAAWLSVLFGIKHWGFKSSYLLYLFLGTIFFTSTGFILSAPRYLLSIPPFFVLLAKAIEPNKLIKFTWIVSSGVLLFYISYEFAWGHWTF